jgi:hypothetical protein
MELETSLGTLTITEDRDDYYPGFFAILKRGDTEMLIGKVEVDEHTHSLITRIYGNGLIDEPTYCKEVTRIDEFFQKE